MSLKLKSGFTFDYDNLYGEGKVTKQTSNPTRKTSRKHMRR